MTSNTELFPEDNDPDEDENESEPLPSEKSFIKACNEMKILFYHILFKKNGLTQAKACVDNIKNKLDKTILLLEEENP